MMGDFRSPYKRASPMPFIKIGIPEKGPLSEPSLLQRVKDSLVFSENYGFYAV
jgi:hypothetical protein